MKLNKLFYQLRVWSHKGILLFEVLLALLILAVGITSALQAFRHIVDITKRSRDYFEAHLITSDIMFTLFATPELAERDLITGHQQEFTNDDLTLSDQYYFQCKGEDVALPAQEEESEQLRDDDQFVTYKKVATKISKKSDMVLSLNTFNVIKTNEEQ